MHKKLFFSVATLVLIVITGVAVYSLRDNSANGASGVSSIISTSPQSGNGGQNQNTTDGEPITAIGTVGCLTPKDTSGPQTLICAIGIKQDSGKSYALYSQDPSETGSLPSGQKVQVSGTLTHPSTTYDVEGTINVTSIEKP